MIDRKLIVANAPNNIGEQVHVNHTGCEAGVDNKRRLYIKRTDKGLVAYCHHCSDKGYAKDENRLSTWLNKTAAAKVIKEQFSASNLCGLNLRGFAWLTDYYCDANNKNCFNGVKDKDSVALTLYGPDESLLGWQVRNLLPKEGTPKYTTHYVSELSNGDPAWFNRLTTKTLVITEDYLSAWRVGFNTTHASMALLRTSLSDKALFDIERGHYETIIIWLDPDEAGRKGAAKVYEKLNHFLPQNTNIVIFDLDKEPKECTPTELQTYLN